MGFFSRQYQPPKTDGMDAAALLMRARAAGDPRDAHAYLTRAEALAPDDLRVQRELLMRGNLHLRDPRHVSFHVIKSYLLHAFEHPEQHDETEQRRMAREIFDEPRLHRCLQLSDQPDAFLQSYLQELCADYVRIFILPDASHCRSFLGFTMPGTQAASMAVPAYDVLHNTFLSPDLTQTEQRQLAGAFYRAYRTQMNGHTQPLDERLGDTLGRLLE